METSVSNQRAEGETNPAPPEDRCGAAAGNCGRFVQICSHDQRLDASAVKAFRQWRFRPHILQKLSLHSVPELILYAVRKGIIS